MLLALAAILDWEIIQLDIKTAFLNPMLQEETYMELPEGYHDEAEGKVYQLKKSMYGLKQVLRTWYSDIDQYLCSLGFIKSTVESNLYILPIHQLYLILYVDEF